MYLWVVFQGCDQDNKIPSRSKKYNGKFKKLLRLSQIKLKLKLKYDFIAELLRGPKGRRAEPHNCHARI